MKPDDPDRAQDQEIGALRSELAALRGELRELEERCAARSGSAQPTGLYAAACGDYKILVVVIVFGGGLALLVGGGILSIFGVISLGDLREFFGIAKSALPVVPLDAGNE